MATVLPFPGKKPPVREVETREKTAEIIVLPGVRRKDLPKRDTKKPAKRKSERDILNLE